MNKGTATVETLDSKRTDLMLVDPRNIVVEEGFNERSEDNYGDIEGLAKNIVANGVIDAIFGFKVRNEDRFVMTEGHRRLRATLLALKHHAEGKPGFEDISKIERIPMRPSSSNIKERLYIMANTGSGNKVPLTDMEKSRLYNRVLEVELESGAKRGEAVKAIIARLGISQATFYNTLGLNDLPEQIKSRIIANEISGSTVTSIVRELKDPEQQVKAVELAVANAKAAVAGTNKKAKATVKNVKGSKNKTPMGRIAELVEKLETDKVSNSRANALKALMKALDEKQSLHKLYALFV